MKESGSGLTKEQYFEMCEILGSEPNPDEIPVSREDLFFETQQVFDLYDVLPARWEGFSGQYMGKDLMLLPTLFDSFNIDKAVQLYSWKIIPIIDNFVADDIAKKIKSKTKEAKN